MNEAESGLDKGNLLHGLPDSLPAELFQGLAGGDHVRIERILSKGQASPPGFWYDQENEEFVLLVQGRARLAVEGRGTHELGPGDYIVLPARLRHRVEWTDPDQVTVWLAVHYERLTSR
jgi:cupin 2 domain-containing protein